MTHDAEMPSFQLDGPGRLKSVTIPRPSEISPGDVEVRLELAGICGSDRPGFITGQRRGGPPPVGFPVHECLGTVLRSGDDPALVGKRVIAIPHHDNGLSQVFHAPVIKTHVLAHGLPPRTAILAQPLATVLAALDRVQGVPGTDVAVLGLGSIGLMFGYVLRQMGASSLTGFDRRNRKPAPFTSCFDQISDTTPDTEYDLVVEAVGHNPEVLNTAIAATKKRGTVLAFGVPDDDVYAVNYRALFRKSMALVANVQPDWQTYLPRAEQYVADHPDLADLVTDVFEVDNAQQAFESAFINDNPGQGKVLIDTGTWARNVEAAVAPVLADQSA